MVVRWTFTDQVLSTTRTLAINPSEGGSPEYRKHLNYESSAAPDGKTIVSEGRDEPQKIVFSGVVLTEAEHDAWVATFSKRYQLLLTDDLGREMWVYVESFVPKRVRSAVHPWKHQFEVTAAVLDWDV